MPPKPPFLTDWLRKNTGDDGRLTLSPGQRYAARYGTQDVHGLVPVKMLTVLLKADEDRMAKMARLTGEEMDADFLLRPFQPENDDDQEPGEEAVVAKYVHASLEELRIVGGGMLCYRMDYTLAHMPQLRRVHFEYVDSTELLLMLMHGIPSLEELSIDHPPDGEGQWDDLHKQAPTGLNRLCFKHMSFRTMARLLDLVPLTVGTVAMGPVLLTLDSLRTADDAEACRAALSKLADAVPQRRLVIRGDDADAVVMLHGQRQRHMEIIKVLAKCVDTAGVKILKISFSTTELWPQAMDDLAQIVPHLPDSVELHVAVDGDGGIPPLVGQGVGQRMKVVPLD